MKYGIRAFAEETAGNTPGLDLLQYLSCLLPVGGPYIADVNGMYPLWEVGNDRLIDIRILL